MYGERIRSLRKERNLTQEELCNLLGIRRSIYTKYELEQVSPGIDTLIKLSDFFNVSIDYLVGRSNIRHTDFSYEKDLIGSFANELQSLPVDQDTTDLYSFISDLSKPLKQYSNEETQLLFKAIDTLTIYHNDLLSLKETNPRINQKVLSYYQQIVKEVIDYTNGILNSIYRESLSVQNDR